MSDFDDTTRHFVRQVLGCGCPDEVLRHIERAPASLGAALSPGVRIDVGGRLLIFVLEAGDEAPPASVLGEWLGAGREERDRLGFNRFRLVLIARDARALRQAVDQVSARIIGGDDRLHVHVLDRDVVPALLRPSPGSAPR